MGDGVPSTNGDGIGRAADGTGEGLRFLPALRRLTDRELTKVARGVTPRSAEPGQVLVREGDAGRDVFVIAEGVARVTVAGQTLCELQPGEIMGEMAMLDGRPRTATVTALTRMTLLPIGPPHFYCFAGLPPVALAVLKSLTDRLRVADERLAALVGSPAAVSSAQDG